jgi:hypothetical protein
MAKVVRMATVVVALAACADDSSSPAEQLEVGVVTEDQALDAVVAGLVEFRTIDGAGNNPVDPARGRANVALLRVAPVGYADGVRAPAGSNRPSARAISNIVHVQLESVPNGKRASDYLWQWGQLVDHDIDLTSGAVPRESFPIPVPAGDPFFDPSGTGQAEIPLSRSAYSEAAGVREQVNEISAYIDASFVYGSDAERAAALRTLDGTGRLRTSAGDLLPLNTEGLPNAALPGMDPASLFLAGDVRANEQVALTALHTLFVREHNRLADRIRERHPDLGGDRIYELSRAIVGAEVQVITYREFAPLLLGHGALPAYPGYDPSEDAGIANEFAHAGYRLGHSLVSGTLLRLGPDGAPIAEGNLALRDGFFAPDRIAVEGGIEPILRGLAGQEAQNLDVRLVDDIRNFLFGPPGAGGFDLAALNLQRGRDHGLASYNDTREAYGLPRVTAFADITTDPDIALRLETAYGAVDDVDLWSGALAEDHLDGALVGEVLHAIMVDQLRRLRDGDRFYYRAHLPPEAIDYVESLRLGDLIALNTDIGDELAGDVFRTGSECAHAVCETGQALDPDCSDSCVAAICAADPYCCDVQWDSICVDAVDSECGRSCEDAPSCGHSVCTSGAALDAECGFCEATICDADPYCCDVQWDDACVDAVATQCGLGCGCGHDVCDTGGALDSACSTCASAVCAVDPYCCAVEWDDICVDAVAGACDRDCEDIGE